MADRDFCDAVECGGQGDCSVPWCRCSHHRADRITAEVIIEETPSRAADLEVVDLFGHHVRVAHGVQCVALMCDLPTGSVVLSPDQARHVAEMLLRQADNAAALTETTAP